MRGYKGFDRWLRSNQRVDRPFRFKVGETYSEKGRIVMCRRGFHFCPLLTDVFSFYPVTAGTRICEVEADDRYSVIPGKYGKCVCRRITILRELSRDEILRRLGREESMMSDIRGKGYGKSGLHAGNVMKLLSGAYAKARMRKDRRDNRKGVQT